MNSTDTNRQPLTGQHFQVAVIGGGITGVAIARECARAGKRTLLIEQRDFASGTTSRSSRILSGLRSLEQGDVAFAREKIREKQRLVRERSHLVHPSHFLMALSPDNRRSAMTARTALWLYRRMTGSKLDTSSFEMEHKKLERALDRGPYLPRGPAAAFAPAPSTTAYTSPSSRAFVKSSSVVEATLAPLSSAWTRMLATG